MRGDERAQAQRYGRDASRDRSCRPCLRMRRCPRAAASNARNLPAHVTGAPRRDGATRTGELAPPNPTTQRIWGQEFGANFLGQFVSEAMARLPATGTHGDALRDLDATLARNNGDEGRLAGPRACLGARRVATPSRRSARRWQCHRNTTVEKRQRLASGSGASGQRSLSHPATSRAGLRPRRLRRTQ